MISAGEIPSDPRMRTRRPDGMAWLQLEKPVLKICTTGGDCCTPINDGFLCGDVFVGVEKGNKLVIKNSPADFFGPFTIFSRDTDPGLKFWADIDSSLSKKSEPTSKSVKKLVMALADRGFFEKAVQITPKISDQDLRDSAFQYIALTMAYAGQFDDALGIATPQMIQSELIRGDTVAKIVAVMARAGLFEKAVETIRTTKIGCPDNEWNNCWKDSALSETILPMVGAGSFDMVFDTIQELYSADYRDYASYSLTDLKLTQVVGMMADAGEFDLAFDTIDEIRNLRPDSTHEASVRVVGKMINAGEFGLALKTIEERLEPGDHNERMPGRYDPAVIPYIALARIAKAKDGDAKQFDEAFKIVTGADYTFQEISVLLARFGLIDKALKVAEKITGNSSDLEKASEKFYTLVDIASFAPAERKTEILERASGLANNDCHFGYLSNAWAKAGRLDKALEAANKSGDYNSASYALDVMLGK